MRTSRLSIVLGSIVLSAITCSVACSSGSDEGLAFHPKAGKTGASPDGGTAADPKKPSAVDPPDPVGPADLATVPVVDAIVPVAPSGQAGAGFEGITGGPNGPTTIFMNRNGGTFRAGNDDSAHGTSSVLQYYGRASAQFPAARYSDAEWQQILACVSKEYAGINVQITDQKPAGGAYLQLNVGDTWANVIGLSSNIGGIAPLGPCQVVPQAVGFVFGKIYDQPGYGGLRGVCEAAAHEIGHSLSLSHESLATDLMSYAAASEGKHFQDRASSCGTTPGAESCSCGAGTQDAHSQLLQIVGAQSANPPPPPPPPPSMDGGAVDGGEATMPTVSIFSPAEGSTLAANSNIDIVVDSTDSADVSLYWAFTNRTLACDASIQGVTCTKVGNRSTWTLFAGSGARSFFALATGASGTKSQTPQRTITLGDGTPKIVDAPPTISPQFPAANMVVEPGGEIVFQAQVTDDKGVADVRAVWSYNGGSYDYVMAQSTTPGVYVARTSISTVAPSGPRTVTFQAKDTAGQRTVGTPISVEVR